MVIAMLRVVAALIQQDGRFLLAERPAGKARAGMWEFPGGKVEAGEEDEVALARELREELGVQTQIGSRVATNRHRYSAELSVELHLYSVEILGEPVALEHAALGWFTPSEIPLGNLCEADRPFIQFIKSFHK